MDNFGLICVFYWVRQENFCCTGITGYRRALVSLGLPRNEPALAPRNHQLRGELNPLKRQAQPFDRLFLESCPARPAVREVGDFLELWCVVSVLVLLVLLVAAVLRLSPLRNCGASGASGASGADPYRTVVQPFSRCSCGPTLRGKSGARSDTSGAGVTGRHCVLTTGGLIGVRQHHSERALK